jgi:transcriptional regulator with XRE-family HTH domain
MKKDIGKKIYEMRIRRNLTQEELAERIGSVPSYISNIERNNKCPSLTLLTKIVKALDTTYNYLLMDDFEVDKQIEIKYKDMFREVTKLDESTQKEFFNIVEEIIKSLKNIEKNK